VLKNVRKYSKARYKAEIPAPEMEITKNKNP
jgi:hypothetical protein